MILINLYITVALLFLMLFEFIYYREGDELLSEIGPFATPKLIQVYIIGLCALWPFTLYLMIQRSIRKLRG